MAPHLILAAVLRWWHDSDTAHRKAERFALWYGVLGTAAIFAFLFIRDQLN